MHINMLKNLWILLPSITNNQLILVIFQYPPNHYTSNYVVALEYKYQLNRGSLLNLSNSLNTDK